MSARSLAPDWSFSMSPTYPYQFYEMAHAALAPARAVSDAAHFVFSNPLKPALQHAIRQERLRERRDVRAPDAPLRQAGFWLERNPSRRRPLSRRPGHRLDETLLQSHPLRPARLSQRGQSAEASDRRADVRAITRPCFAARSRRFCPITTSTLPTGPMREWFPWRWDPSTSTTISTTCARFAGSPWPGRAHDRGLPAFGAAARRGGADGGRPRHRRPRQHDAHGRPGRHPPQPDRGQQAGGEARRRVVPPQLFAYSPFSLSRLRPGGLSGISSAQRLHGDEHRPPRHRSPRNVQSSRLGR